ncbi:Nonaspanin (TM9SF) [Dillenia turbinata]|uniref:Transmembrane 9 superfamily member n=1 Tax=Dillenia turbinata TaxID=194707 RepID=A0AAN8V307_9MAGN
MTETSRFRPLVVVLLTTLLGFSFRSGTSSPDDHRYNVGDLVPFFVNKVGPLKNPSETYQYYELPFCHPELSPSICFAERIIKKKESLGEVLNGDRLTSSLYELKFKEDEIEKILCQKKLGRDEVAKFRDAVVSDFYFQLYCDDLPLWGYIGKIEDESWTLDGKGPKYYLFTHVNFDVLYNADQIIEVRAFSDPNHVVDITKDIEVNLNFTYSVSWNATSAYFENRMKKYSRASLLPTQRKIHWFSFLNSVVIIVLSIGLLAMLFLQHLRNDMRRCSNGDEEEDAEAGWKHIRGDVFRYPPYISLFCAILGSGTQFFTMACFLFVLSFVGVLYPYNRGALCTSLVVSYVLTSVVAGYTAASFYNKFADNGWGRSVILTGILYVGPLFLTVSFLNTVSISYGVTAALPFGTIMAILLIWIFVSIPLLILGGLIGSCFSSEFQVPFAPKRCPREIPKLAWYRKTPGQMLIGGLLPFSAIALELHNLCASIWGYKIYTLPIILLLTFVILIITVGILSVGFTYIQLSVEDHEWWWRSVLRGGSVAIFMFLYSVYFYAKSSMRSFLQLTFFLGYNACMCYAFFLMLGAISFYVSLTFVRRIYHAVKSE